MNLKLKTKVLESGKPQIWLAHNIGISESWLSKIVMGWVIASPRIKNDIAQLLNCRVEEIFGNESISETGEDR